MTKQISFVRETLLKMKEQSIKTTFEYTNFVPANFCSNILFGDQGLNRKDHMPVCSLHPNKLSHRIVVVHALGCELFGFVATTSSDPGLCRAVLEEKVL